jgi:hypothetical protein
MGPNPDFARKIEIARPPIHKFSLPEGDQPPSSKAPIRRAPLLDTRIREFRTFKAVEQAYDAYHFDLV